MSSEEPPDPQAEILCVGELLWDSLPAGLFLGGAPFNVAAHLRTLGAPVALVSRVGDDRLGAEALQRVARRGVATDLVQLDPALPTGFVSVSLAADGTPSFEIAEPAAWDAIEATPAALDRARRARALVFGSLAQRGAASRAALDRLCESDALKVFDANLRPPYDDPGVVERSLARADFVKLSEQELARVAGWFGLPPGLREGAAALAERFRVDTVCVSRGGEGALLLNRGRWSEHRGFRVRVRDTVGAGDAFLAALLSGLLSGAEDLAALQHANLLGAYVATQPGAVPDLHPDHLDELLGPGDDDGPESVLFPPRRDASR